MSYLQLELGGKLRGLKFNQLAIEIISTHNDNSTNSGFMYAMIYGGLMGNSYVKREEVSYTFEDVCDWVDVMGNKAEAIAKVTEVLTSTQVWKTLVKAGEEINEEKKKVQESSATTISSSL
jgi:hypothetical protein